MDGAQTCIEVNNCNVNAEPFVAALERALDRGVAVRILTSEHFNDLFFAMNRLTNRVIYKRLATQLRRKNAPGALQLRWHPDARGDQSEYQASHTKALFIDEQIVIVGSGNMDEQTWKYSGRIQSCR